MAAPYLDFNGSYSEHEDDNYMLIGPYGSSGSEEGYLNSDLSEPYDDYDDWDY